MSGFYKYAVIYRTTIIQKTQKIILDPVTIEVFHGPRDFEIPQKATRIIPSNQEVLMGQSVRLNLDEGAYVSFIARTKERDPVVAEEFCKQEINRLITLVAITHTADIFDVPVYDGWLVDDGKAMLHAWLKRVDQASLDTEMVKSLPDIIDDAGRNDPDLPNRLQLMSKFYAKSLPYDPGEEKFLFLWTILEVFPIKGTAKYQHVTDYLVPILNRSRQEVRDRIGVGLIYKIRSKLTHAGEFDQTEDELSELMAKLERIVVVVLRNMVGLPYNGSLDGYFDQ